MADPQLDHSLTSMEWLSRITVLNKQIKEANDQCDSNTATPSSSTPATNISKPINTTTTNTVTVNRPNYYVISAQRA